MRLLKHHLLWFLAFFVLLSPALGRAAEATCQFEEQLASLNEIQNNPNLPYPDNIQAELGLRKRILEAVIDCSAAEAQKLQDAVRELPEVATDAGLLKNKFLSRLSEAMGYYRLQKSKIGDLGIRGSKDLAKNLYTWRSDTYAPLAMDAGNLILWVKNQNLFRVADWRFRQITQTVTNLKLLEQGEVRSRYYEAEQRLNQAKLRNDEAGSSLGRASAPEDTANKIKASLQALSDTYQSFFDLSTAVKKLLPL